MGCFVREGHQTRRSVYSHSSVTTRIHVYMGVLPVAIFPALSHSASQPSPRWRNVSGGGAALTWATLYEDFQLKLNCKWKIINDGKFTHWLKIVNIGVTTLWVAGHDGLMRTITNECENGAKARLIAYKRETWV